MTILELGKREGIVVHEDQLHAPLALLPNTLQPDVSRDQRLTTRMTASAEHRAPQLRDLSHQVEKDLVSTCAIRSNAKCRIYILAITRIINLGRLVNTKHLFEQRVCKLFRLRSSVILLETFFEISLGSSRRKVEANLVDSKRARAAQYRLRRRDVT